MSSPARYWVVVFLFSAALCACGGRSFTPVPFTPAAAPALTTDASGVDDANDPDVLKRRCATAKLQPGWVFRGACKVVAIARSGGALHLPMRNNFALAIRLPRNDAATGQRVTIADAVPNTILPRAGHPFPQYKDGFFYFKTSNREKIVRFRKTGHVTFVVTSGSAVLGGPCTIARLVNGAWKVLPVAGTVSGTTLTYIVPAAKLPSIPHGPAYVGFGCQKAPTPSPSPSPTTKPTATPTTQPTPAYCSTYSVPTANPSGTPSPVPMPINVQDNSKLGGAVVMYVWNGAAWMNNAGAFSSGTAVPIPLSCFPGSTGAPGRHFQIPGNVGAGRLYISYAPSPGSSTAPNPLAGMASGGPPPSFGGPYWNVPWDVVELGTTSGAIVDLTAVTDLGLPIEIQQTAPGKAAPHTASDQHRAGIGPRGIPIPCASSGPGIVGVTSCNYANIYAAMSSLPQYKNLVATGTFNGKIVDLRIINPSKAQGVWNFGSDWFYNPNYLTPVPPQCLGVTLTNGYLSCVLHAFATTTRLYVTTGSGVAGVTGSNYCVSSDGSANFGFTNVKNSTSCTGITYTSPNTSPMPIALFKYGTPPVKKDGTGCQAGFLFGLPPNNNWITKGKSAKHQNVFASGDAFAVWKGLALDLNRGSALAAGSHPAGGWAQNFASPAPFTDYYNDPLFNEFAYVLHYYYDHHQSYALSYDEPGGQASAFAYVLGDAIDITVNRVPTAAAVSPVSSPVPYPIPSPCTVFPTNV